MDDRQGNQKAVKSIVYGILTRGGGFFGTFVLSWAPVLWHISILHPPPSSPSLLHLLLPILIAIPPQTRAQARVLHAREQRVRAPGRRRRWVQRGRRRALGRLVEPVLLLDPEPHRVVVVVVQHRVFARAPLVVLFVARAAWGG